MNLQGKENLRKLNKNNVQAFGQNTILPSTNVKNKSKAENPHKQTTLPSSSKQSTSKLPSESQKKVSMS